MTTRKKTPAKTTASNTSTTKASSSTASRKPAAAHGTEKWSQEVTEHSDAMDLKAGVFKEKDPKKIAESVAQSAEHSDRRKSEPFRSAMSMLTFYENRAGHNLPAAQRQRLDKAKDELRAMYDKPDKK